MVMALINGMRVSQYVSAESTHIVFNADGVGLDVVVEKGGELPPQTSLSIPEGKFRFLYLNCRADKPK